MYSNYNNNYATPQNASVAIRLADLEDLQQGYPSQFIERDPQPDIYHQPNRVYGDIGLGQGNPERDIRAADTTLDHLAYPTPGTIMDRSDTMGVMPSNQPFRQAQIYVNEEASRGVYQDTRMDGKRGERSANAVGRGRGRPRKGAEPLPVVAKKGIISQFVKGPVKKSTRKAPAKKKDDDDDSKVPSKMSILNKVL